MILDSFRSIRVLLLIAFLFNLFTYTIGYSINLPFDNIVCSLTLLMLLFNTHVYVCVRVCIHQIYLSFVIEIIDTLD